MKNKQEEHKKVFNDIFDITSAEITRNEETEKKIEETKTIKEVEKRNIKKRTYNIPNDILEDIEKVVYMDRDIKDNTGLVIKALREYLRSKEVKILIEEYEKLKGGK